MDSLDELWRSGTYTSLGHSVVIQTQFAHWRRHLSSRYFTHVETPPVSSSACNPQGFASPGFCLALNPTKQFFLYLRRRVQFCSFLQRQGQKHRLAPCSVEATWRQGQIRALATHGAAGPQRFYTQYKDVNDGTNKFSCVPKKIQSLISYFSSKIPSIYNADTIKLKLIHNFRQEMQIFCFFAGKVAERFAV